MTDFLIICVISIDSVNCAGNQSAMQSEQNENKMCSPNINSKHKI